MKRDELLLGLKSRFCLNEERNMIHSSDGTFCLNCGRINYKRGTFQVEERVQ